MISLHKKYASAQADAKAASTPDSIDFHTQNGGKVTLSVQPSET